MSVNNSIIENENQCGTPSAILGHNAFIVWKPEYDLGIPIIDEQHRGIVTIINSLYFGTQTNYIKNIFFPIINMLRSYADIHFQTEECYIKAIDYPGAARHCSLHQEYTLKLAWIERENFIGKDPHQLMEFLKKWWLGHICEEDVKFMSF